MRKGSLRLIRIAGIDVFIHWTFLILIAWVIFSGLRIGQDWERILFSLLFILLLFVCVTMHEYGHAIVARQYGVKTMDITLLPIGGIARMDKFPDNPKQELKIAIAGPLVNFVIAVILFFFYYFLDAPDSFDNLMDLKPSLTSLTLNLIIANIAIGVFNLIPAFPMDGGRILRAFLAMRTSRVNATKKAASVGQIIAMVFGITGVFFNPFLIIIAVFVFLGAQFEASSVESISFLEGYKVREVMRTKYTVLNGEAPVSKAVEELLAGADQDFVVTEAEKIIGILSRTQLIKAISEDKVKSPIREIIRTNYCEVEVGDEIKNLYSLMQENKYKILPIMDKGKFIGIVDMENLLEFIMIKSALHKV